MDSIAGNTIQPFFKNIPLLSLPQSIQTRDLHRFSQVASEAINLSHCRAYNGQLDVEHLSVSIKLGPIRVFAAHGTGIHIKASPDHQASFIIPLETKANLICNNNSFSMRGNRDMIYLPPLPWELSVDSSTLSILIILVEIKFIHDLMTSRFGLNQHNGTIDNVTDKPIHLGGETQLGLSLADSLQASLRLVESVLSQGCNVKAESDMGNLLLGQLLFLWSDKLERKAKSDPGVLDFEELVDWIRQNCCDSICLADLESISGYTGRSLQRVFQRRFGCGPMQFLRKERLSVAHKKLESAQPGTCITDIIESCGYQSASSFYRDFKEVYKVMPATVLGRLWQTSH